MESNQSKDSYEILIVDDTPENLHLLSEILVSRNYSVRMAPSGKLALLNMEQHQPDLVLADIKMPDMDGFELCVNIKSHPKLKDIPIIFLSALDQTDDKVKAFSSGGVDYITKPFSIEEVLSRVSVHLKISTLQRQLTEANAKLKKLATTDPLTDLYNRRHFFELAEKEFARASRFGHDLSLLMIDLDNFKTINDTCGHSFGDTVLLEVAKTIRSNCRDVDIHGRFGGDEFVLLILETDITHTENMAMRLCDKVSRSFEKYQEIGPNVTISIGVANYTGEDDIVFDDLFNQADEALYRAKMAGRNCFEIWKERPREPIE